uniref:Uncharacterized protein n=1 Tax=Leersia perrieri TaxID=77586 RepID=A0A0D9VE15_9ORYZ
MSIHVHWVYVGVMWYAMFDSYFSGAGELINALSYARANPLMRRVKILGREEKLVWIPNDNLRRLIRSLNMIHKLLHKKKKCLLSLTSSSVLVDEEGRGVIQGATVIKYSTEDVCRGYNETSAIVKELIIESVGLEAIGVDCIADFRRLLHQMENVTSIDQEYILSNHASLIPDFNRTSVFHLFHDHIMGKLAHHEPKLKNQIINNLPYDGIWIDIAYSNCFLRNWLNTDRKYKNTGNGHISFNKNVRSSMYDYLPLFSYTQIQVDECLYCEFPDLLLDIEILLWMSGEIEGLGFEDKFS